MTLAEAAAEADALAQAGDERALAKLRTEWQDEVEAAARHPDYRVRAQAYRAIAQFRYRQKRELLRRGLEDESPAARGSALIALEGLSRDHPGDVNAYRPLLHELASRDPNVVRPAARSHLPEERKPAPRHDPAARGDRGVRRSRCGPAQDGPRRPGRAQEEGGGTMSPQVAVLMGSRSDWETMEHAVETLAKLEIEHEVRVLSAHRTPAALDEYVADVEARGVQVFVAAAGGAAHLAGVVASKTLRPVLGVPMGTQLGGLDSLLSTVQMPAGIPVGTLAIGRAGAVNAALLAAAILAVTDEALEQRLRSFRDEQARAVLEIGDPRPASLNRGVAAVRTSGILQVWVRAVGARTRSCSVNSGEVRGWS